jgi:glutaredoxin 3
MKLSHTVLAIASVVAVGATAATAFSVVPRGHGLSDPQNQCSYNKKNNNRLGVTFLRMDTDEFAKSEIDSNDVSGNQRIFGWSLSFVQSCTIERNLRLMHLSFVFFCIPFS